MTEKKIHPTHFQVTEEMPWKKKKEKQMNKTIYLGRLSIGFGWYSGDPFYLFKLILLEMDNSLYHDWTTLFELQIIRFAISIILEE